VHAGVVADDGLHALPSGTTVLDLVRAGLPAALTAGSAALTGPPTPLGLARLLPPLTPPTIRDFVAFEEHVEGVVASVSDGSGVPAEWYEAPTFYFTNPYALIGAHDDVPVPPGSRLLDFELEVAAVVGRDGSSLTPAQARDAIFGYTVFNDWSARDLQRREMKVGLGPAKGKDSATTLGPWLVTADELAPFHDEDGFLALDMRVSVNGVEVGHDLLSNMGWPFAELVSYASRGTWVRAGDVLGSGTCGNGGCLAELWGRRGEQDPPALRPGDVVEMTVEGIGTVRNRVVPGIELPPVRAARSRTRAR
jgi:2-keto-4-pentenoate hydratase/2-oxohepta-3-ene-1,7-dioic acid hydratase in catechol pathway